MEKYYSKTDESQTYAAAIVLHPTRKIEYIHQFRDLRGVRGPITQ